jgi:hypothetical protein
MVVKLSSVARTSCSVWENFFDYDADLSKLYVATELVSSVLPHAELRINYIFHTVAPACSEEVGHTIGLLVTTSRGFLSRFSGVNPDLHIFLWAASTHIFALGCAFTGEKLRALKSQKPKPSKADLQPTVRGFRSLL